MSRKFEYAWPDDDCGDDDDGDDDDDDGDDNDGDGDDNDGDGDGFPWKQLTRSGKCGVIQLANCFQRDLSEAGGGH